MLLSQHIIQSNLCPGLFLKCSEGSNLLSGCSCSSVLVTAFSSKVPLRYKKNAINGKLHRAKKIFSDFQSETTRIFWKFLKAGFPHKVIGNNINNFKNVDEEVMIPRWLFDEKKAVAINWPFSNKNEHF